jgi:hypothetical protein
MKNGTKSIHAATIAGAATYTKRLVKSLGFYPETTKFDQGRGLLVLEFDSPLIAANAASKLSYQFAQQGNGGSRVSIDSGAEKRGDDVVGVVTIHLDAVAAKGLNSRTGAKAVFATVDQVADMFKTLSDVERASIKGNTAKMQTLLKSLAPMVDRDRAKLPKDAVAYYDEMRRKAGMSRLEAKSQFAANQVDLWNYFSRNDWTVLKHNATERADYERFAKKALTMQDFVPPSHREHGPTLHQMAKDALEDIKRYKEEVRRYKNRAPWDTYSRSNERTKEGNMKTKFAVTTYEQAEYQIALAEERTELMKRKFADRQKWIDRANGLMHKADAGDKKAQNEIMQIANLLESAMRSGFSRTGAKAKFSWNRDTAHINDLLNIVMRELDADNSGNKHKAKQALRDAQAALFNLHDSFSRTGAKAAFNSQGANAARGTYPTSASSSPLFSVQKTRSGEYVICKGMNPQDGNTVVRVGDRQSMRQELRELSGGDDYSRTGAKVNMGMSVSLENLTYPKDEGKIRATGMIDGRSVGSFEGTRGEEERIVRLAIDSLGGDWLRYPKEMQQYIELNPAAKKALKMSRTVAKSTHAADDAVSNKIAKLVREGYDQKQAAAIAYDMKRRGEL